MAELELKKALALNPGLQGVHTKIGNIRLTRGDSESALYHYTEALKIYPFDRDALFYRGMILENLGRYKEAVSDFKFFLSAPGKNLSEMRPYAEERVRELSR